MEEAVNRVNALLNGAPYRTEIRMGNHLLIADEPLDDGGKDLGPKPHDILLAALSSCTVITLKMYAARKKLDLSSVSVDSEMRRTTESGSQITSVIQTLTLIGDLDVKARQRLLEIAAKCPVHKTLAPAMSITINLKES